MSNKSINIPIEEYIPPYLSIALSQIGVTEVPGRESNPIIDEYLKTAGLPSDDEIPWCAAFVNWCLKQEGFDGTGKANARSFLDWGLPIWCNGHFLSSAELVGSIVVLARGNKPWMGHVGFFLDKDEGAICLLGGNQSNRVSVRWYNIRSLLGIQTDRIRTRKEVI